MRAPHSIFAVLATVGLASAVQFTEIAACGQQCYNSVKNNFATYGCSSATDMACLCARGDYSNAIKDCASQTCLGADVNSASLIQTYASDECAAIGAASQANPNPSGGPQPPPSTSVIPGTTTSPEATSSIATVQGSSLPTADSSATTTVAAPSTTVVANTATTPTTLATVAASDSASAAATSATSSSSPNSNADSNADSASDTESSSTEGETESGGSLTTTAKIGIGVGSGAAVAVLAALLFALCRRRHDNKRIGASKSDLEISVPLPGSGRWYASDDSHFTRAVAKTRGAGKSELEINSTRYENMVPRTQPSLTLIRK